MDVVAFSVLVLVLMFRPTGILGESPAAGPGMSERDGVRRSRRGDQYSDVSGGLDGAPRPLGSDAPVGRAGSSTCC